MDLFISFLNVNPCANKNHTAVFYKIARFQPCKDPRSSTFFQYKEPEDGYEDEYREPEDDLRRQKLFNDFVDENLGNVKHLKFIGSDRWEEGRSHYRLDYTYTKIFAECQKTHILIPET